MERQDNRATQQEGEDPWVVTPGRGLRQIHGVQVIIPGHPEMKVYKVGQPDIDLVRGQELVDKRRAQLGLQVLSRTRRESEELST